NVTTTTLETSYARCLSAGESEQDLHGQLFRYAKVELKGAKTLIASEAGDPLVTVHKVGKGTVVFAALSDLLGEDERITPFAAHMLAHVFADATPIKVSGDVEYLVNRNENGWVITLINNQGVFKPQQGMAQVDRSAYVSVTLSAPEQTITKAVNWINDADVAVTRTNGRSEVGLSIAPGGVAIIELR